MAGNITRFALLPVACLALGACATGDPRTTASVTQTTTADAAQLLGCDSDEVALCIDTNCELEEYYCANRNDARVMFKAGEFRY